VGIGRVTDSLVGEASELSAMVGVDDALRRCLTGGPGHVKGRVHQGGFRFPINGPPDRFSRTRVQDHTGVNEALPRGMFRNVGHPSLVRTGHAKVPFHQITRGSNTHQVTFAGFPFGEPRNAQLGHDLGNKFVVDYQVSFNS